NTHACSLTAVARMSGGRGRWLHMYSSDSSHSEACAPRRFLYESPPDEDNYANATAAERQRHWVGAVYLAGLSCGIADQCTLSPYDAPAMGCNSFEHGGFPGSLFSGPLGR